MVQSADGGVEAVIGPSPLPSRRRTSVPTCSVPLWIGNDRNAAAGADRDHAARHQELYHAGSANAPAPVMAPSVETRRHPA